MSKSIPEGKDPKDYKRCTHQECGGYELYYTRKNYPRHKQKFHADFVQREVKGHQKYCDICKREFNATKFPRHERSARHRQLQASQEQSLQADESTAAEEDIQHAAAAQTLQAEAYKSCILAHARSLTAFERYNGRQRKRRRTKHGASRGAREAPKYLPFLRQAESVYPLSAEQYMETKNDPEAMRRAYVVCTSEEARNILEDASPLIPLLVRSGSERHEKDINTIKDMLLYLSTKPKIDIHRWDTSVRKTSYNQPKVVTGEEAQRLFLETDVLINFLNLANVKDNPVPEMLDGVRAYKILKEISEDNLAGKREETTWTDLSSCVAFHILAKAGVFSLPHIDHHGVITTATCDEGEKLWLTWPTLTEDELRVWQKSNEEAPAGAVPFPIYIRCGDVLIQPTRRLHAPYSITDVLMSGTMHWDSREMASILRSSLLEFEFPNLTNEEPAQQFDEKIEQIDQLWHKSHIAYPWGNKEQYKDWSSDLKKWRTRSAQKP